MTREELALVLDKHRKWLNNEVCGERADLRGAVLRDADLSGAVLRDAGLRNADLRGADLRGVDLDYAAWPLWCGSLGVHVDERITMQLLYHVLYNVAYSKHVSDEVKRVLLTPEVVELANRSHVVHEHGKAMIEPHKEAEHA